jgi:opacity protein-like surface antigen
MTRGETGENLMKRLFLAAVAAAALLAAPAARAQSGVHTHDGLYLHLEVGVGALASSASQGGTKLELSGGGGGFGLSLGGAVTPNLVLAGQLWSNAVSKPTAKLNGTKLATTSSDSFGLAGIGLEVTYYVMPLNLYLTAVPTAATLSMKSDGTSGSTKTGFALKLAVGKEWWVSDNWGLGLNVQYIYGTNKDKDDVNATFPGATFTSGWFGVALSGTYN